MPTKPIDMRNIFSIALMITTVILLSCNGRNKSLSGDVVYNPMTADGKADPSKLPEITFETDTHDFGTIQSGDMVRYSFKFKNTGKSLLVISDVSTSCGCTVSDFPKEPVKPGEGGTIDISFDSHNRKGMQNKSATVFSNTQPPTKQLHIKAMVTE